MVISPSDINSYRVNEQGKYRTQVLQIFLTIKTFRSGRHTTTYTVYVAVLIFKVIRGEWFSCHLKANMGLPINDQWQPYRPHLAPFSRSSAKRPSRSFKVNDFHLIWHGVCHFLLVINSNLGRISHRYRDTVTYSFKHSIQNCSQTTAEDTWLLLTAYRKLPPPYLMVPSQTFYDLPFSHNTARLALHSAL